MATALRGHDCVWNGSFRKGRRDAPEPNAAGFSGSLLGEALREVALPRDEELKFQSRFAVHPGARCQD